jgi:hypothetical protein
MSAVTNENAFHEGQLSGENLSKNSGDNPYPE